MARILVVVAAVASTVALASPAQARGGGCRNSVQNGIDVSVCSADNGIYMFPDAYINVAPLADCTIESTIRTSQFGGVPIRQPEYTDCRLGRADMQDFYLRNQHPLTPFYHWIKVYIGGSVKYSYTSPPTYCC